MQDEATKRSGNRQVHMNTMQLELKDTLERYKVHLRMRLELEKLYQNALKQEAEEQQKKQRVASEK